MPNSYRTWWRPLWSGLGIDPDGKHSKQMKTAVWLFLYLILVADPRTGIVSRSYSEMSRDTGRKKKTVKKWMAVLRKKGYVVTGRRGEELFIRIRKWKSVGRASNQGSCEPEMPPVGDHPGPQSGSFGKNQKVPKPLYSSRQNEQLKKKNDIGIDNVRKDIYKDVNVKRYVGGGFDPKNKEELLAMDLAAGLNDVGNLNFYLSAAYKYPEKLLREVYSRVREIPEGRIRKSKGALFVYLLKIGKP